MTATGRLRGADHQLARVADGGGDGEVGDLREGDDGGVVEAGEGAEAGAEDEADRRAQVPCDPR